MEPEPGRLRGFAAKAAAVETIALLAIVALAAYLRFWRLGNVFQSGDNAEAAAAILRNPGYRWMAHEFYGLMINLWIKICAAGLTKIGVRLDEFWWKTPIALIGTANPILAWAFFRRVHCGMPARLTGAAMLAVLPIHVFQSRYLLGYEVLGAVFSLIAIWSLLAFFERPDLGRGLLASALTGLYTISHGYILPFGMCLAAVAVLGSENPGQGSIFKAAGRSIWLLASRMVWLFPYLTYPLWRSAMQHAYSRPTKPGFYLLAHWPGFVGNVGYLLAAAIVGSLLFLLASNLRRVSRRDALLMAFCAGAYLCPLALGVPPGITVVRGYMLVGTCFCVYALALCLDELFRWRPFPASVVASILLLSALWGTRASLLAHEGARNPTGVTLERGGFEYEPGAKAAGAYLRTYLDSDAGVLALHRSIECSNLYYYFNRRERAFNDLTPADTLEAYFANKDWADVVICDERLAAIIEQDNVFGLRAVFSNEGVQVLWIYARPEVDLPRVFDDVRDWNRAYNREFAPRVSFL